MFNFLIEDENKLMVNANPHQLSEFALGNACTQKMNTFKKQRFVIMSNSGAVMVASFFGYCHNKIQDLRVLGKF